MAETVASCYGDTNIRKKEAGGQNLAYLVQRNQTDSCPSVFMEMQKKSLLEKFLSPARNGAEPRLFILNDEMLTGISYIHNEEQNQVAFAVVVSDKAARARAGKTISSYSGVFESWDTGDEVVCMYVQNISPIYGYSINVFDIHVPDTEGLVDLDGYGEETSLLAKKVQDLHTFFHLVVRDLTQEEEQMLDGYIYKVYEQFGITEDNDSVFVPGTRKYKEFPLLGDLFDAIKDEPVLRKVYNILVPLVNGSLSVYNRKTNVNLDNKYIVFDMNGTKGQNLALSMFVTLDFVWSKIKENRLAKKAVFVDEAWQLIGTQGNEMAAEYVKEIFKTIRAFGGSAFVMTQEITDFFALKNGEYGKAIISNSDTKICLHLDNVEADMMSEIMNLSDDEYKKITTLQRGNGMVATGNTKLFVDFKASPFEKDVITTDPEYLRRKMRDEAAIRQAEMQTSGLLPDAPETDPAKSEENRQVVDLDDFEDADEISLASDDILDFQQETEPKPELEPVVQNNP